MTGYDVAKIPVRNPEDIRDLNPDKPQRMASTPDNSVWVSASAGTGKTQVLTNRVLRLLLPRHDGTPGTRPHKILCLTFTKAGASEMALRVNSVLGKWAVMPLEVLQEELSNLLDKTPEEHEIEAARRLFAQVVDTPGGLNILTIHSFCQSVLGRFPLEAKLSPHFAVLNETQASQLLSQAMDKALRVARPGSPLKDALDRIAGQVNEEQFLQLIREFTKERYQLSRQSWGPEALYTEICMALGIVAGQTPDNIIRTACQNDSFDAVNLRRACAALAIGTDKSDKPKALEIQRWLDGSTEDRTLNFQDYVSLYLTQDGLIRTSLATKRVLNTLPECINILTAEALRLTHIQDQIKAGQCAALTRDLFFLGHQILKEYQTLKQNSAVLDYDDLITCTLELLEGHTTAMKSDDIIPWVMYKLDQGLDHILIDEAQDTNPEQWKIIAILCEEFFCGHSAREDIIRTVFTVGDEKQSIYSFQRAAPEEFIRMREDMSAKILVADKLFRSVALNISFRSTQSILKIVDRIFSNAAVAKGLGDKPPEHHSNRLGQAGLVELWPLCESKKVEARDPWTPPLEIIDIKSGSAQLAEQVGNTIKYWLDNKELLPSKGRTIQPDDIMILVRTRTAFVDQLMRALKTRNIPVSGADRMVLNEQISVADLLTLGSFALLPEDDLSLACILKSPLIGWSEEQLYDLAEGREGSLWATLRQTGKIAETQYLLPLIKMACQSKPYEFFAYVLNKPCPADKYSGLRALQKRLGTDIRDPLDELLNAALIYENDHAPSLQGFLHWQEQGHAEIKREMEESHSQVRIMTVHGAKGLQSPIVILPDTVRVSRHIPNQAGRRLLWPHKCNLGVPLWSPRSDTDCKLFTEAIEDTQGKEDEEYRRLFYVAMTRAEDRLYIAGYKGAKEPMSECWYNYAKAAFENLESVEKDETGVLRLSNPQIKEHERNKKLTYTRANEIELPDWVYEPAPQEPNPPSRLMPSRPLDDEPSTLSPLEAGKNYRFLRGNITHKLLQFLPDLPVNKRLEAATVFVSRHGNEMSKSIQADVVRETLAILEDETYKVFFAPGSIAEVPISGLLPDGRLVSGQIDRLVVKDNTVYVIDYKSNRPPPIREEDVHPIYRKQMQTYYDVLRAIYPEHNIKCALLWTDGPALMPLKLNEGA